MSLLEIKNINMNYHKKDGVTEALKDINFTVDNGEFISIIGPSGCGKSTLLNIISGLLQPSSGEVTLWGDADVDGKVGISDVVKVMMYVANKDANPITAQGLLNADVYNNGDGVFIADALSIQKKVAQILDTLPE